MDIDLIAKAYDVSTTRRTQEDVIEYYKWKYTGEKVNKKGEVTYEWQGKLATDIAPYTVGRNGQPMSRANIMRRFQNDKKTGLPRYLGQKRSAKTIREYEELGKHIPPIPPDNGFYVSGIVCLRYSPGGCESRKLPERGDPYAVEITGDDAMKFLENPTMQRIANVYNDEPMTIGEEEGGKEEPSSEPCDNEGGCRAKISIEPL